MYPALQSQQAWKHHPDQTTKKHEQPEIGDEISQLLRPPPVLLQSEKLQSHDHHGRDSRLLTGTTGLVLGGIARHAAALDLDTGLRAGVNVGSKIINCSGHHSSLIR